MKKIKSLISEVLEVEDVKLTDDLISFDSWDSLTILSIIALVSDEFGVELTREEIEKSETIEGLLQLIESRR
ncbi:acyl carrier protein [Winogradskyella sp.]|nr:acyl carrier protein [Winogradskyella sp.]MDB9782916.1 acyl carrier protein [Winogradskyella sp.]MDC1504144.1 acyl carrier protein [Winogradskyella sp.]